MDVEHVIFSVSQEGAVEAYEQAFKVGSLAAHIVFYDDHLPVTVFTSDTPKRLAASHKAAVERAVAEAASNRYVQQPVPKYGWRVNRQLGRYFMNMAWEAVRVPKQSAYAPALITS